MNSIRTFVRSYQYSRDPDNLDNPKATWNTCFPSLKIMEFLPNPDPENFMLPSLSLFSSFRHSHRDAGLDADFDNNDGEAVNHELFSNTVVYYTNLEGLGYIGIETEKAPEEWKNQEFENFQASKTYRFDVYKLRSEGWHQMMEALEPLDITWKSFTSHRIELTDDTLSSPDTEEGRRFQSMLKRLLEAIRKENAIGGDQANSSNDEDGGRAAANGGEDGDEDDVFDMFSELMEYLYHSAKFWDVIIPDELATLAAVQEFLTVRDPTTIEEVLRPVILAIIEQEDSVANKPF